jgi:hypothetical protein
MWSSTWTTIGFGRSSAANGGDWFNIVNAVQSGPVLTSQIDWGERVKVFELLSLKVGFSYAISS